MAATTLVDDVGTVIAALRRSKGDFSLAMLYSNYEGGNGDWNLIVSAPWADKLGTAETVRVLAEALRNGLAEENRDQISRITVLDGNDPFVAEVTSAMKAVDAQIYISNSTFGGVLVPRGILLYSQRPSAVQA